MNKKNLFSTLFFLLLSCTSSLSFAGLINVSVIKITPSVLNTSGWLQVSEVIASETGTGNDLALSSALATATGSSNWSGSSPNNAIDGVAPAAFPNIFHSNENDGTSFLSITLAAPSELDWIEIFGRTDGCCSERDIYDLELFDNQGTSLFVASNLYATQIQDHQTRILLTGSNTNIPTPGTLVLLAAALLALRFASTKK